MPSRAITVEGKRWLVFPSGRITQYDRDEFGLIFVSGTGPDREVRVTRYSPVGARSRDILGRVYEYFLTKFASAESRPRSGKTPPRMGIPSGKRKLANNIQS